uniref:Uncharacterized protein LOC114349221 n=1 Tax=Diabrotica virgifera virgifera TaxID=50390 RepID=A0A6P7H081_DIAVI
MSAQENSNLNQSLAKAIFISGSPLSLVEHPIWIDFFKKLKPSYKFPTRKCVSTTLLDKEYKQMKADLSSNLAIAKNLHLQCDGWSNVRKESIVNFVISKPEPIFVEFLATILPKIYIFSVMAGAIYGKKVL